MKQKIEINNDLIKKIKAETFALHFLTSFAAASAVPPVAIKSSTIITLSSLINED